MLHSDMTLNQRLAFLETLELPDLPEYLAGKTPALVTETPKKAGIDAGQVIAFSEDVSKSEHADILNSCLLAQLAASKKFDREKNPVEWYQFYSDVLFNCGWVLDSFQFRKYQTSSASFGIDTFMLNLLQGLATDSMLSMVTAAINFLKSLSSTDPRSLLFDHNSHSGKEGNFQLGACFHNGGVLTMSLGCSYFSASQAADSFFFLHFESADSEIYFSKQNIMLDLDVYAKVRKAVVEKLGDRAERFIEDLDI